MKKAIIIFVFILMGFPLFGQNSVEDTEDSKEPVCSEFDPSVWEDPSRAPLRARLGELMGTLNNKTITDIGAGAGYFGFEYARSAEKVILTELDQRLIDYMIGKMEEYGFDNVVVKKGKPDFKEFKGEDIDFAIMVDVYHELEDPKKLLPELKSNMNSGGKILIVESHISPVIVTDYLEAAGFENIKTEKFSYNSSCGPVEVNIVSGYNDLITIPQ